MNIKFDEKIPKRPAIEAPCFVRLVKYPGTVILVTQVNWTKSEFTGLVISIDGQSSSFSRVGQVEGGWDMKQFERIPGTATITLD